MNENGKSPKRGQMSQEEREASLARFRLAEDEGKRWHEEQMREDNPDPQGRMSLLVPLGRRRADEPEQPSTPSTTSHGTAETLALFGDDPGRNSMTVGLTPRRSTHEIETDLFNAVLHLRLTGDRLTDLAEIERGLDDCDLYESMVGESDLIEQARCLLYDYTGEIAMEYTTGHPGPWSPEEVRQKDILQVDINAGRRRQTLFDE